MRAPITLPGLTLTGIAGHGAHGPILRGEWNGAQVTIRHVRKGRLPAESQQRRIRTLAGVTNDHLARVLHVEETDDTFVLVTEHIEGPALTTLRSGKGELSLAEGWRLLADLSSALAALHSRGVVHGDISPANVLVRSTRPAGRAVLIDVGAEEDWELGTAGFRAPEIATGSPLSMAADVWSAGRVALWAVGHTDRAALSELLRDVLEPDPERRPGAAALVRHCEQFAGSSIGVPDEARLATAHLRAQAATLPTVRAGRRARRRPRPRRRNWAATGIAFAAIALLTYAAVDLSNKPAPTHTPAPEAPTIEEEVRAPEVGPDPSPEEVAKGLSRLRDRALAQADEELLEQVTAPGSEAARADRELLQSFRGSAPAGLSTMLDITQVLGTPERPVVETVLQQGPFTWRGGANDGVQVAPLPPRCARIHLLHNGNDWRVHRVSACAAEEISG